jgi:NADH:ubiquinone reductase (H+-translocating)
VAVQGRPDTGNGAWAANRPRVVIVGGGFGGLSAAKALARADLDVTLVDRGNHHLFQPLLYQVATGILSDGEIAPPLRGIFRHQANLRVHLAEVTGFDLERRMVFAVTPAGDRTMYPYDFLIVAAGSTHAYFGHDEWSRYAPGLKSLRDAHLLRTRILGAFEMGADAVRESDRDQWLTFVIVGAGPTGVELAGQIAGLAHRLLVHEYGSIHFSDARIALLEGAPTVLGSFPKRLREIARQTLEGMGVEIRTDAKVTGVDAQGVDAQDANGQRFRILARTIIWAAGVEASPLGRMLADASGARVDHAGRLEVNPDCTLPGRPEAFAIGDMISLDDVPGLAQPAIQEGRYVARTIKARLRGHGSRRRFHYFDKGTMAAIGQRDAVVDVFGLKLGGIPAMLLWGVVHVAYLVGWGNRLLTVGSWLWSLAFREQRELCITDTAEIGAGQTTTPKAASPHARAPAR